MKRAMFRRMMAALAACVWILYAGAALADAAYVDNGSDPQSRLNMRSAPTKDAASLGKFYSGTQVEIVADAGGGWSQVTIGSAGGYMMTQYLRESMNGVTDARPLMRVASPYGTPAVVLRDRPGNSYDVVAMLAVGESVRVLGTSGDFCYILTEGGAVGCLAADELK